MKEVSYKLPLGGKWAIAQINDIYDEYIPWQY